MFSPPLVCTKSTNSDALFDRWRSTQDLPSYQQCHGPTTSAQCFQAPGALQMSFHGGELILYLPASSPSRVETKMAGSTLLASKERCGHGHSFADGFTRDQDCVALLIEYSVPYPRGGLHFARVLPGSPPHCVHTIEQGAAARRWMPCVDCVQVRFACTVRINAQPRTCALAYPDECPPCLGACPSLHRIAPAVCTSCPAWAAVLQARCSWNLHITAESSFEVHASGHAIGHRSFAHCSSQHDGSVAGRIATESTDLSTWSFVLAGPTLASEIGFVVGRLRSIRHPTLHRVTIGVGCSRCSMRVIDGNDIDSELGQRGCEYYSRRMRAAEAVKFLRLWPQILHLSRHLPALLGFLR
jgi:hypothetical protein